MIHQSPQVAASLCKTEEGLSGRLLWCIQELQSYDGTIEHVDGKTQQMADFLTKWCSAHDSEPVTDIMVSEATS